MAAQGLIERRDGPEVAPTGDARLQHEAAEFRGALRLHTERGAKVWTCAVHGAIPFTAVRVRAARLRCGRCEG